MPTPARSWAFWSEVTGWPLSATRGDHDEFATLLPPRGDAWLKVQAVADGPGGIHLDLDVDDVHAAAARGRTVGRHPDRGHRRRGRHPALARRPDLLPHALARGRASRCATGAVELVDQVCLDCPVDVHDAEVAFWTALTGWAWADVDEPELSVLRRPAGIPFRLLFQRLGEPTGPVRAHADLACADRQASLARHLAAGAQVVEVRDGWTVMTDPVGRVYCLTDRSPTAPPG